MSSERLRYCTRCCKMRLAEGFGLLVRSDGRSTTACAQCRDAQELVKTKEGRAKLYEQGEADRAEAAKAWSQALLAIRKNKNKKRR